MVEGVTEAFSRAAIPETIRTMDTFFEDTGYSLKNLFRDEQRKILNQMLESTMEETETIYRQVFEDLAPLMRFLKDTDYTPPYELRVAAEMVLNAGLRRDFQKGSPDFEHICQWLKEAKEEDIPLDEENLEYVFRHRIEHMAQHFSLNPDNILLLQELNTAVDILNDLPFKVNLWKLQNVVYDILNTFYPQLQTSDKKTKKGRKEWIDLFLNLCRKVAVRVEDQFKTH
jgi:hypothetical protein